LKFDRTHGSGSSQKELHEEFVVSPSEVSGNSLDTSFGEGDTELLGNLTELLEEAAAKPWLEVACFELFLKENAQSVWGRTYCPRCART
jgi:hypothetical protein